MIKRGKNNQRKRDGRGGEKRSNALAEREVLRVEAGRLCSRRPTKKRSASLVFERSIDRSFWDTRETLPVMQQPGGIPVQAASVVVLGAAGVGKTSIIERLRVSSDPEDRRRRALLLLRERQTARGLVLPQPEEEDQGGTGEDLTDDVEEYFDPECPLCAMRKLALEMSADAGVGSGEEALRDPEVRAQAAAAASKDTAWNISSSNAPNPVTHSLMWLARHAVAASGWLELSPAFAKMAEETLPPDLLEYLFEPRARVCYGCGDVVVSYLSSTRRCGLFSFGDKLPRHWGYSFLELKVVDTVPWRFSDPDAVEACLDCGCPECVTRVKEWESGSVPVGTVEAPGTAEDSARSGDASEESGDPSPDDPCCGRSLNDEMDYGALLDMLVPGSVGFVVVVVPNDGGYSLDCAAECIDSILRRAESFRRLHDLCGVQRTITFVVNKRDTLAKMDDPDGVLEELQRGLDELVVRIRTHESGVFRVPDVVYTTSNDPSYNSEAIFRESVGHVFEKLVRPRLPQVVVPPPPEPPASRWRCVLQ
jgi:hypothetical protein